MGLWFFLSVLMLGNLCLKAYKLRLLKVDATKEIDELKREINKLREDFAREKRERRLEQLEEAVFFGDFELKRKFADLHAEMDQKKII